MARLVSFPYYGGKYWQLKWLLPLLPNCDHYVEPFCGAASALLNREISPLETINDTNGEIVNFFKVLRDQPDELIRLLNFTPYSREEFVAALEPTDDKIEQARRFYVKARQSFGGVSHNLTAGRWKCQKKMSKALFPPKTAVTAVDQLNMVARRIRLVQIENSPALEILEKYDHEETLFYCDPPYVKNTCDISSFGEYALSDDDHHELAQILRSRKGRVAVSGHRCKLYDKLYGDWFRHDKTDIARCIIKTKARRREESLWTNYEVSA